MNAPLHGLRILLLEDEFLIAMDVEQICLDFGAASVTIVRSLDEAPDLEVGSFDAGIIDIMLAGESTLDFAGLLLRSRVPFVFASGYADRQALLERFPGVTVVGKPYSDNDLIDAIVDAIQRFPALD